jgi:hypothetical protein
LRNMTRISRTAATRIAAFLLLCSPALTPLCCCSGRYGY